MEISVSNLWRRSSYSIVSSDDAHGENGVTIWVVQRQQHTLQTDLRSDRTISPSPKQHKINNDNKPPPQKKTTLVMDAKSRFVQKVVFIFIPLSYFPHLQEQSSWGKRKEGNWTIRIYAFEFKECVQSIQNMWEGLSHRSSLFLLGKSFWTLFTCVWIALLCKLSDKVRKAGADIADLWLSDIYNM